MEEELEDLMDQGYAVGRAGKPFISNLTVPVYVKVLLHLPTP